MLCWVLQASPNTEHCLTEFYYAGCQHNEYIISLSLFSVAIVLIR